MILLRVLWGDAKTGIGWTKVWRRHIVGLNTRRSQPAEQLIYVYGRNNADKLVQQGFSNVELVDDDPWPDGMGDVVSAKWRYLRPWKYKFVLIRKALEEHGSVVYCDWDVVYQNRDWDQVEAKLVDRNVALVAYWYKKVRHATRPTRWAKRVGVSGSWLYFSDTTFVDEVLKEMNGDEEWSWHDELVMGNLLDREYGGWMGEEEWLRRYESPVVFVQGYRSPWPKIKSDDGFTVTRETPVEFQWERIFVI